MYILEVICQAWYLLAEIALYLIIIHLIKSWGKMLKLGYTKSYVWGKSQNYDIISQKSDLKIMIMRLKSHIEIRFKW